MAQRALVTFDLYRETQDYKTAYRILREELGLIIVEPEGKVFLPNTTVIGDIPEDWTAETLRQAIAGRFEAAGVNLEALFCGVVSDFAGSGPRVEEKKKPMLSDFLLKARRQ